MVEVGADVAAEAEGEAGLTVGGGAVVGAVAAALAAAVAAAVAIGLRSWEGTNAGERPCGEPRGERPGVPLGERRGERPRYTRSSKRPFTSSMRSFLDAEEGGRGSAASSRVRLRRASLTSLPALMLPSSSVRPARARVTSAGSTVSPPTPPPYPLPPLPPTMAGVASVEDKGVGFTGPHPGHWHSASRRNLRKLCICRRVAICCTVPTAP